MSFMRAKNIFASFKYAFEGFSYSIKTQRNMRIHTLVGLLALSAGVYLEVSKIELCILILVSALVIAAEMFNTAIESTIDLYSRQRHPLAKIGKDVAAGAVLVCAFAAAIIGLMILGSPILKIIVKYSTI
jgi:diacylglycerol kinase (ATP)